MEIGVLRDLIQKEQGNLEVPEIRVWCHPHRIAQRGADTWETFPTFAAALNFIKAHPEAEDKPLLAFRGYEINLWTIDPKRKGET